LSPNPLQAVSVGPSVLENRGCQKNGIVHTVFQRVVNIAWSDGSLSSISRADMSNGPGNIVTNLPSTSNFTCYGIKPGTLAFLDTDLGFLQIGSIYISLKNCTYWHSPLAQIKQPIAPSCIKSNLEEIITWLINKSDFKSYPALIQLCPYLYSIKNGNHHPAPDFDPLLILAAEALGTLLPALSTNHQKNIKDATLALLGLGPGLTPSGDDYVTGLLLSLAAVSDYLPDNLKLALEYLRLVVKGFAAEYTNRISLQMLLFAVEGLGSELMDKVICLLLFGVPANNSLIKAILDLIAVGASSGFDQLLGILSGAILYAESIHCHG